MEVGLGNVRTGPPQQAAVFLVARDLNLSAFL